MITILLDLGVFHSGCSHFRRVWVIYIHEIFGDEKIFNGAVRAVSLMALMTLMCLSCRGNAALLDRGDFCFWRIDRPGLAKAAK